MSAAGLSGMVLRPPEGYSVAFLRDAIGEAVHVAATSAAVTPSREAAEAVGPLVEAFLRLDA